MPESAPQPRKEDFEISTDKADLELIKGGIIDGIKLEKEPALTVEMAKSTETPYDNNGDSSFTDPEHRSAGLFDGSTESGSIASSIASEVIQKELATIPQDADVAETIVGMENAFRKAHEAITQEIANNPDIPEMSSSATMVRFVDGPEGRKAVIINAGVSRVYIKREGSDQLEQITTDDDMISYLIKHGDFLDNQDMRQAMTERGAELLVNAVLSKEDIAKRKQEQTYNRLVFGVKQKFKTLDTLRHFTTNSLGGNYSEPRLNVIEVEDGDKLILTTDGIHDNLMDGEIKNIIDNTNPPSENAATLVAKAKQGSTSEYTENPSVDDMTCVIINVDQAVELESDDLEVVK